MSYIAPDLSDRTIRIAAFDWTLTRFTDVVAMGDERFGYCNKCNLEIAYQQTFASQAKFIDTLFHEIFHAIYWAYGVEDEDKEERVVGMLATAWTQVHRDNPWLIDLAKECLSDA